VRLLANVRCLGHVFNPIAMYYCFDPGGERVRAIVADVENIPWGERHPYVLARGEGPGSVLSEEFEKALHVSPLMGMDHSYTLRASDPAGTLSVHIDSSGAGEKAFDATLSLKRRELSRSVLTRMLVRYPLMPLQIVAKIYAQTIRLKLKGARYFPHPEGRRPKGFLSP